MQVDAPVLTFSEHRFFCFGDRLLAHFGSMLVATDYMLASFGSILVALDSLLVSFWLHIDQFGSF